MLLAKRLARGRIYYGWYIVAVAFVSQAMSIGLQVYTFGIFLKPMSDDLGWTRGEFSAVQSVYTVVNGLAAVFVGPFIDRRGSRELMVVGAVVAGLGMAAISLVQELWQFYLVRGVIVTLGMVLISNIVVTVAVSNWFIKHRGRAMAIGMLGTSIAGIVLPPLTQALIEGRGWRGAWVILGLLVTLSIAPVGGILMRRRPEDLGLLPDGERGPAPIALGSSVERQTPQPGRVVEYRWERRQAMRTSALWLLIIAFSLASVGLGAILLHLFSFMTDKGFSPAMAAAAVSVNGGTGLIAKPIWGFLIERLSCRYCAAIEFIIAALGIAFLLMADSVMAIYASIILFAIASTGTLIVQEVIWAEYFGRLTLGAIRSVGVPVTIVTSAGGPLFAGLAYDMSRSYQFAFGVFIVTYVLAAAVILLSRPPSLPTSKQLV